MELVEENKLFVLKENLYGELEWSNVSKVNLGSCKKPNLNIKQIKIQPIRTLRL
jgi:hypothetical protein